MSLFNAYRPVSPSNKNWSVGQEYRFRLLLKYFVDNENLPDWARTAIYSYADQLAARYERLFNVTGN